jgi:urea transporter
MTGWLSRVWDRFATFVREITTARDNHTADLIRVTGLATAIQYVWLAGANWQSFDPEKYGIGTGLMLTALGVAMRVARPTEPDKPKGDET